MSRNLRIGASKRWACATVVAVGALAGCGGHDAVVPGADGAAGMPQPPAPGKNLSGATLCGKTHVTRTNCIPIGAIGTES